MAKTRIMHYKNGCSLRVLLWACQKKGILNREDSQDQKYGEQWIINVAKEFGYVDGVGMTIGGLWDAAERLGLELGVVHYVGMTVNGFKKRHGVGDFIVGVKGHCFAVGNGHSVGEYSQRSAAIVIAARRIL